jgi:hypothetical protein
MNAHRRKKMSKMLESKIKQEQEEKVASPVVEQAKQEPIEEKKAEEPVMQLTEEKTEQALTDAVADADKSSTKKKKKL